MKSSEKRLLCIEIFMIIVLIINVLFLQASNYIMSIFIIAMFFGSVLLLGYENDRHRFKKDGILLSIVFALIYEILIYLSGLYVGFLRSSYNLSIIGIIQNMIPFILITITGEVLRYEFMQKGEKKRLFFFLTIILFILLDTSVNMYMYNITSSRIVVEIICLVFIPSISKNILLTYWMKKFGVIANVIYLLITTIVTFMIPILPNFNKYLQAVISLVYPIILYFVTRKILKESIKFNTRRTKRFNTILGVILGVTMLTLIALTSGIFKYYFLTIGSGSMEKEIFVGDVVVVEKLSESEYDKIDVGTILVFKIQDKIVVHRVVEISDKKGAPLYYTKGDNNEERDEWVVSANNLIGRTRFKIPMIGLPSVWLYNFVEGRELK